VHRTERIPDRAIIVAMAALLAASPLALAGGIDRELAAGSAFYADPADWPQLTHGYRSALGFRLPEREGLRLGGGSATTGLLARYARASDIAQPLFYAIERAPRGLGLRGSERVTGLMLRGGGWSSAFEAGTSTDAFTAARRTVLSGQLYAPLIGRAGLAFGLSYSAWQSPALAADPLVGPGYGLFPGRADAGSQQITYQLQLNYAYGERNLVGLTYNSRREWEHFRLAPDPLAPEARQLSLSGEHWFSPSWALRYEIPAPEPGNLIRRQGLRLGLHYRF
jgi:hypothetical protein